MPGVCTWALIHPCLLVTCTQSVVIDEAGASLLPQAFPQLTTLRLIRCRQDAAALLTSLRSCKHLNQLAMQKPQHTDPLG